MHKPSPESGCELIRLSALNFVIEKINLRYYLRRIKYKRIVAMNNLTDAESGMNHWILVSKSSLGNMCCSEESFLHKKRKYVGIYWEGEVH